MGSNPVILLVRLGKHDPLAFAIFFQLVWPFTTIKIRFLLCYVIPNQIKWSWKTDERLMDMVNPAEQGCQIFLGTWYQNRKKCTK
jgi:hypothetical protein